jgi:hypothetical protein
MVTWKDQAAAADVRPADSPNRRLEPTLKIIVVVLGLFILAGLVAVAARIFYLAKQPAGQPPPRAAAAAAPASGVFAPEIELALPAGAEVKSVAQSGTYLAVHYQAPDGAGVAVVDLATGRTLSRVRMRAGGYAR